MPSDLNRPPADMPRAVPPEPARPAEGGRSVPELLSSLVGQVSTLFRKEIQLARAELGEKFGQAASAVMPIAAGGALLLASLVILLFALAAGLTWLFGIATGLSLLIVGVAFALIGYLLVRSGVSQLKVSNLVPERTAEQLSRDADVAKEQVR
ncbi:phage holin family protein [Crenalkalicoccus roseus]|uniref:phage holin family protein n=1 Tax=Crenalkalicoccus roseus TaxID=1485588 RepID=UPI001081D4D0|nr:phage holin family protein [Crenalkalicoccus roseus]